MLAFGWGASAHACPVAPADLTWAQDKDRLDVGWASVWVKTGALWLTGALYAWTLLAPAMFPDRDFS